MGKLFTTETLSKFLQVSPRTIRRERNDGHLRYVIIRGQIRYREEDILRYLDANNSEDSEDQAERAV